MLSLSLPSVLKSPKPTRSAIKLHTWQFPQILKAAKEWDQKHRAFDGEPERFFLDNFCFGDQFCLYASAAEMRHWDIPEVIHGCMFTRCEKEVMAMNE